LISFGTFAVEARAARIAASHRQRILSKKVAKFKLVQAEDAVASVKKEVIKNAPDRALVRSSAGNNTPFHPDANMKYKLAAISS
jgi:hypothetical protein